MKYFILGLSPYLFIYLFPDDVIELSITADTNLSRSNDIINRHRKIVNNQVSYSFNGKNYFDSCFNIKGNYFKTILNMYFYDKTTCITINRVHLKNQG